MTGVVEARRYHGVRNPVMTEWVERHKGPGAVVVVVTRGGPVFAKGFGFADVEARRSFTADSTVCGRASTTH